MSPMRPRPICAARFSPQVCLSRCAERFSAVIGPTSSKTMIGTDRNVTTFQAAPMSAPMIRPRTPNRSSMAWMMTDTVADRTAHGRMRCRPRLRDAERHAERRVAALEPLVRAGAERGEEVGLHERDADVGAEAEEVGDDVRVSTRCRR